MAVKVVYKDESFNTEYEIGDLVNIKENIFYEGLDLSNLQASVISTTGVFPLALLNLKSGEISCEVYQNNVTLISDYSSQKNRNS